MKCPQCSAEMSAGTTKVAWSTVAGIFEIAGGLVGDWPGSQQYLYFYPENGSDSVCVFEGVKKAFHCPRCKVTVIEGDATGGG